MRVLSNIPKFTSILKFSGSLALALALGLGWVVSLGALPIVVLCTTAREQFAIIKSQLL